MSERQNHSAGGQPSPFEADEEGLELVPLDAYSAPARQADDFEVTVEEPAGEDGLDFELIIEEPVESGGAGEPLASPVGDADGVVKAMQRVEHPDGVMDLLAHAVIPQVTLSVVMLVRDGVALGQRACGSLATVEEVKGLVLPLAPPSLLWQAVEEQSVRHGSAAADSVQQVISRYLGTPDPTFAGAAPVVLGRRVVNLVCVQTTDQEGLADTAVDALSRLCEAAAASYLRLIQEKKVR